MRVREMRICEGIRIYLVMFHIQYRRPFLGVEKVLRKIDLFGD